METSIRKYVYTSNYLLKDGTVKQYNHTVYKNINNRKSPGRPVECIDPELKEYIFNTYNKLGAVATTVRFLKNEGVNISKFKLNKIIQEYEY